MNGLFARTALKYGTPTGHATGLPRVPYDGYPAILHEGEQVLTRVEADKQKNGTGGVHVAKLADSIIVREEADIDKFATAFARKISICQKRRRLAGKCCGICEKAGTMEGCKRYHPTGYR